MKKPPFKKEDYEKCMQKGCGNYMCVAYPGRNGENICLKCYEKNFKALSEEQKKPNFTNVFNI